ncbi:hypothetical protein ACP70R_044055 [Stipagrostis hirtigluma subsp. patula]
MASPAAAAAAALLAAALVLVAANAGGGSGGGSGSEADALLAFRDTLRGPKGEPPEQLSSWSKSTVPCDGGQKGRQRSPWHGVTCKERQVRVLQLEGLGLQGRAPALGPLAPLHGLRSLSLAGNNLTGGLPDLFVLPDLKMLYLSRNRLAGEIPYASFAHTTALQKLHLEGNAFSGPIPRSLASMRKLVELNLSDNNFSGPIPEGLQKFGAASFSGNAGLCGSPLNIQCNQTVSAPQVPSPPAAASSNAEQKCGKNFMSMWFFSFHIVFLFFFFFFL